MTPHMLVPAHFTLILLVASHSGLLVLISIYIWIPTKSKFFLIPFNINQSIWNVNNSTSTYVAHETRYCLTKVCIFTYIPKFHLNLLIFSTSFRYPTKWSMQVKESIQCHKLLVFIRIHFQPKSLPNNQMPLALASTVTILSESGSTAGASSDDTYIYTTPQLTHVPQGSWLGIWEGLGCWEFVNVQRAFHIGTNILTGGRDLCMIKLCYHWIAEFAFN